MTGFGIVAIAASAGGLKPMMEILRDLPESFAVPIAVVQHLDPHAPSLLAVILARHCRLRVRQAVAGDVLVPGSVFVAPPDHHLLVNGDGTLALTRTELVHFVRPSADLLLESAAASCGPRATAVILSGSGHDGAMGVKAIWKMGGTVIVQDPASAQHSGMPQSALLACPQTTVLPLAAIGPALMRIGAAA